MLSHHSGHLGFPGRPSQEYRLQGIPTLPRCWPLPLSAAGDSWPPCPRTAPCAAWDLATLQQVGCGQRAPAGRAVWRLQDTLRPGGRALGPPARLGARGSSPLGRVARALPLCPHCPPPHSCMTSRRPRRLRVLSPSTPFSRPSSAAQQRGCPLLQPGGRLILVEHRWAPRQACPTDARGDDRPAAPGHPLGICTPFRVAQVSPRSHHWPGRQPRRSLFLFSAPSAALAQYHTAVRPGAVPRVAGQAPTLRPAWASQYLL